MQSALLQAPEAPFRLGTCVEAAKIDGRPSVRLRAALDEEADAGEWIPCMAGVNVRVGDEVLLAPVKDGPSWVAIGVMASAAAPTVQTTLPHSGYELSSDTDQEQDRVQLRDAAGVLHLELRIVDGRMLMRFPTRDAVLECDGNLELRAGEGLRLTAKDYELNVSGDAKTKAEGKVQVDAAEQVQNSTGPMRLEAKKNMVINGRFILLNTKDQTKWS